MAAIAKLAAAAFVFALPWSVGIFPTGVALAVFALCMLVAAWAVARGSRWAVNATLTLVSVTLSVAVLEVALRALGFGPTVVLQRWPPMPLVTRFFPNLDRELQYADLAAMIGEPQADARRIRLVTDARGFRNGPDAPRSSIDVILLGDSLAGGAAGNDETIRGFLAKEHGFKVIDLSTPASGPWHEYVNFAIELPSLDVRKDAALAWIISAGNDLDDPYDTLDLKALPWQAGAHQWLEEWRAFRGRSAIGQLRNFAAPSHDVTPRKLPDGRRMLFYSPYAERLKRDAATLAAHPNVRALEATLARTAALARERGMRPIVFVTPLKEEVYAWLFEGSAPWAPPKPRPAFAQFMAATCARVNVTCVDLAPAMTDAARRAFESGRLLFWRDDSHPSVEGNRAIAALIAAEIRKR